MNYQKQKLLEDSAKSSGCSGVDEYVLQCELTQAIQGVKKALDRAVILSEPPDLWEVYKADRDNQQKRTKKQKRK